MFSFSQTEIHCRAGSALVLHASSPKQEKWETLKQTNPLLRTLSSWKTAYDDSENPVVSSMRSVTDTVAGWFEENETAQVARMMKALDPGFTQDGFERELREYIVPEVVDAYLSADQEALRAWCGEGVSDTSFISQASSCSVSLTENCFRLITFCGRRWSNTFVKGSSATRKCLIYDKSISLQGKYSITTFRFSLSNSIPRKCSCLEMPRRRRSWLVLKTG